MNWVTSRTFFSLLEHSSFEVPAIKAFQLLSLLAVIICGFADYSPSQVLKIQKSIKMILPISWTHSTMASSTPMIMSFNLTSATYSCGHTPRHCHSSVQFSLVQSLSRVRLFETRWIAASQASLSITNSRSLPKLMSIKSVMLSGHLILCHPLLLLPPIPSSIRVFSNESTLHEVAKVLEFQLQHQSFQWTPRTGLL